MKKTTAKLQLKKSTIRLMQDSALADVQGGGDDADCRTRNCPRMPTNQPILCSCACN
jgi:hypothetical protein